MKLDSDTKGLGWIVHEDDHIKVTCSDDQFTFKVVSKDKSFRGKTFKGEYAWSKSQRYASDSTGHFYYR